MSLSVRNLSYRRPEGGRATNVSFNVAAGEIFGLYGTTRSGAEALARVLSGRQKSDGGMIEIDGKSALDGRRSGSRVVSLFAPQRGVAGFLGIAKASGSRRTLDNLIARFETAAAGGARVAVINDGPQELADFERKVLLEFIRDTAIRAKIAVVMLIQNFDDALLICDKLAVFDETGLVQTGSPRDIYEEPVSSLVAAEMLNWNIFQARRLTSSKSELPEYQTLNGGHRLFTNRTGRSRLAPINQNAALGIRPEQISISSGASFPEDNILRATVEKITFLGPATKIFFDCTGLKIAALVPRVVGLAAGDDCMVGLPPDRIHAFNL